jgi:hypothetical protein
MGCEGERGRNDPPLYAHMNKRKKNGMGKPNGSRHDSDRKRGEYVS